MSAVCPKQHVKSTWWNAGTPKHGEHLNSGAGESKRSRIEFSNLYTNMSVLTRAFSQ